MFSGRRGGLLALALACLFWSTTYVVVKPVLADLPPLTLAVVRFAVAACVLLPVGMRDRGPLPGPLSLVALGFFGVTAFFTCFNFGLQLTAASDAALIQGAGPAMTAALAAVTLGERLRPRAIVGIILSIVGIVLIVLGGSGGGQATQPLLGGLLVAGSAAAWAAYTVLSRRMARFPSLRLTAVASTIGTTLLVPFALAELAGGGVGQPSLQTWLWVVYLGLGPSAAAYLLWTTGLRAVAAAEAGVFLNLIPVLGLLLAAITLGERPTALGLLGGSVVLGSVWLTTSRGRSTSPRRGEPSGHQGIGGAVS